MFRKKEQLFSHFTPEMLFFSEWCQRGEPKQPDERERAREARHQPTDTRRFEQESIKINRHLHSHIERERKPRESIWGWSGAEVAVTTNRPPLQLVVHPSAIWTLINYIQLETQISLTSGWNFVFDIGICQRHWHVQSINDVSFFRAKANKLIIKSSTIICHLIWTY